MFTLTERILLLIVSATFIGGGGIIIKQGLDGEKNILHAALFGAAVVIMGILLLVWAVSGTPDSLNY